MGEITTTAKVDIEAIARKAIREIGYTVSGVGFDADTCKEPCVLCTSGHGACGGEMR